jgi:tetratricopeptide (TPR) repeat protein
MNNKNKMALLGCVLPIGLFFLLCIFLAFWLHPSNNLPERPAFIKNAEPKVEEIQQQVAQKLSEKKNDYDIDQTVMALYSIEKALAEAKNFESLTPFILQKQSDLVAPEIANLKYRFFNVYKKMLEAKDKVAEMDSIYKVTSGALSDIVGMTGFDLMSGVRIDREQAKKVWQKHLDEATKYDKIKNRLEKEQDEMIDLLFEYSKISAKYIKEWNRLCSARDRAYLAFYERDWEELINSAQAAAKMAPHEKEAHTLLALALIERGKETDTSSAKSVIDDILKEHNGQHAPALLLRGVIEMKAKNFDKAVLDFDQSATYYPKQTEEVTDTLSLYKKRSYLNNSKEGRVIINTYRGMTTGAGYFSPDFQKARIYVEKGQKEIAKQKIFDHFFRRRLQGQWDKVFSDFQFCRSYLDTELPGAIDLSIEPAWLTNSVIVTVNNKGKTDIHNITLLLCVRFTDMFKGDYISFPVGDSTALLPAGSSVTAGRQNISDITKESIGSVKKWKDIIEYGAVLISDEVITWVPPALKPPVNESVPDEESDQKNTAADKAKEVIQTVIDSVIQ